MLRSPWAPQPGGPPSAEGCARAQFIWCVLWCSQHLLCGHPPPLRLTAGGGLQALTPRAYAPPLGPHPDLQPSTFTISPGDRLVFYTDGLLEARDRAGRYFRLEDCAETLRHPGLQGAADGLPGGSSRTLDASSTTTSHCSCWRRPPQSRASPSSQMIAARHQQAQQAYHSPAPAGQPESALPRR
jgi:Stage II sporulation protein E (SpoIIE)